jgi:hypothetical protein
LDVLVGGLEGSAGSPSKKEYKASFSTDLFHNNLGLEPDPSTKFESFKFLVNVEV